METFAIPLERGHIEWWVRAWIEESEISGVNILALPLANYLAPQ